MDGNIGVEGYGTVVIGDFKLHDVAFVSKAPFNLISISAATVFSGATFQLTKHYFTLTKEGESESSIVAHRNNGLYIYHLPKQSTDMVNHVVMYTENVAKDPMLPEAQERIDQAALMHGRLGHPGAHVFNQLASSLGVSKLQNYSVCPTCALSKATINKRHLSTTIYTVPLELIQVNLCGAFDYDSPGEEK